MINPRHVVDAFVGQISLIPDLIAAMTVVVSGTPTLRISAFHYLVGADNRLQKAIYDMPAPSILVAWKGMQGGNFDGQSIFRHRLQLYMRMGNAAPVIEAGQVVDSPVLNYEDLWTLICNEPPQNQSVNIRYLNLLPNLEIMDTPSIIHTPDVDGIDMFTAEFLIPEIGDLS